MPIKDKDYGFEDDWRETAALICQPGVRKTLSGLTRPGYATYHIIIAKWSKRPGV
ncbi:MAG: hypothetical protein K8R89_04560 [Anaerolineae bacterium]|nr:hypothetical protein [Anaerolineae bacterium]